jgi:hypothetical protein
MPFLPAKATDKKLAWSDFVKTAMSQPVFGGHAKVAATIATIAPAGMSVDYVPKSNPEKYKVGAATITIVWDPTSWVADFVIDSWSDAKRNALLGHEQLHYMIVALSGLDMFNDLEALRKNEYSKSSDGADAIKAVATEYDATKIQAIHDKYDADTNHDPTGHATEQANWQAAIDDAKTNKKNLRAALKSATLYP